MEYTGIYWAIFGYLGLSQAISGHLVLSQVISIYVYQVSSIRMQVEAGESKLLLFQNFFLIFLFFLFLFFTRASSRGARAPKNRALFHQDCLHYQTPPESLLFNF